MAANLSTVRDSHIKAALKELNAQKKVKYPEIGYSYYADIKGDGRNIRSVWSIVGVHGGVTRSHMNGPTKRATLVKVQRAMLELFDYAVSQSESGTWIVSDPLDNDEGYRIELPSEAEAVGEAYDYILNTIS